MVDYGNTIFEGSLQPTVPLVKPVQDNSGIVAAEGAALAAEQVSKGFNEISRGIEASAPWFKAHFAKEDETAKAGVLTSYQMELLLIADAVEQGLSVPAARMRMRSKNAEYIANNPTLLDDLNNIHSKVTQTAGLGDIVTTGNEEAQLAKKLADDAYIGGWGTGEQAVENMQNAKREADAFASFDREMKTKSAMRQEITEQDKFKATQVLQSFMTASFPWVENQVSEAEAQLAAGGDPGEITRNLKSNIDNEMAKLGYLKSLGGEQSVDYMLTGVNKMVAAFEDLANGTTTTAAHEAKLKSIKAQNELILRTTDPELGMLLSASEIVGNASDVLTGKIATKTIDLLGKAFAPVTVNSDGSVEYGQKPPDYIGDDKDIKTQLDYIQSGVENILKNPTPEGLKQSGDMLTNLLRSFKAFGASSEKATDFRMMVEFWGSPTIGKLVDTLGVQLPPDIYSSADAVLQEQYNAVLLPLVRNRYEDALVKFSKSNPSADISQIEAEGSMFGAGSTDKAGVHEVIVPYWNGTGVEFRASPGYENNALIQDEVKKLNNGDNSIAKPLNALIRAKAHMGSTTDYKKVYEETIMDRLWADPNAPEVDGTDIDALAGGWEDPKPAVGDYGAISNTIIGFEGYRSTAYNDPKTDADGNQVGGDVYRTGFGSDTVTLEDGTVKKVTKNTKITRADAERDLARRINTEFTPDVISDIGVDTWGSLSETTQAALVSVAYNYGSLPTKVVKAAKSGDLEALKEAIISLKGHNGGINKGRRLAEASMIK